MVNSLEVSPFKLLLSDIRRVICNGAAEICDKPRLPDSKRREACVALADHKTPFELKKTTRVTMSARPLAIAALYVRLDLFRR
jgi:hypothetical protein